MSLDNDQADELKKVKAILGDHELEANILRKHNQNLIRTARGANEALEALQRDVQDLKLITNEVERHPNDLKVIVEGIGLKVDGVRGQLGLCYKEDAAIWLGTAASAVKAEKVFGIVELVEEILGHLNAHDLCAVSRVNRTTAAVVHNNIKLRRILGLTSPEDGKWYTPFDWRSAGVSLYTRGYNIHDDDDAWDRTQEKANVNAVHITVTCSAGESNEEGLSDNYPDMQLCFPTIETMQVKASCCSREYWWRNPCYPLGLPEPAELPEINIPGGITLGDVAAVTQKHKREHRLCPYAEAGCIDADGSNMPTIAFTSHVRLADDDPAFKPKSKPEPSERSSVSQDDRGSTPAPARDLLGDYCKIKQQAHIRKLPIPTLAEYQADEGKFQPWLDKASSKLAEYEARDAWEDSQIYGDDGWGSYHDRQSEWHSRPDEPFYGLAATAWTSSDRDSSPGHQSYSTSRPSNDGSSGHWSQ